MAVSLTQAALARKAGLAQVYVLHLEQGVRVPSLTTIWKLADALDVEPGRLLK